MKTKDEFIQYAAPILMAAFIITDSFEHIQKGIKGDRFVDMAESAANAAEKLADEMYFEQEA